MSSALPNPDNDYQVAAAPQRTLFDRTFYNHVFGSIGARLKGLEGQRIELQAVIDDLKLFGLQRLDAAIIPLIEAQEAELERLARDIDTQIIAINSVVEAFQNETRGIIENFQQVTSVNLQELTAAIAALDTDLDAVQERIDLILSGGISASDVSETADRAFVTPQQKANVTLLEGLVRDGAALKGLTFDGGSFS